MPIKTITVVGAGTAGSLAAAHLKKQFPDTVVRQVYTPYVPIIGVGESVTPLLAHFLKNLDLKESEWMPPSDAIFKFSNCFRGWVEDDDKVYFGFNYNEPVDKLLNDTPVNMKDIQAITPDDVRVTDLLVDLYNRGKITHFDELYNELQPFMKSNVMPAELSDNASYAYHIDAEKLGPWVFENVNPKLGVEQIEGKIVKVNTNNNGITSVELETGQVLESDLWVDTTGFNRILIKEVESEMITYDHCPANSACVGPVAYTDPDNDCVNYTQSIWNEKGWLWKIGLGTREGRGLVYSDKYFTDEEVKQEFLRLADGKQMAEPKILKWHPERYVRPASKNVVAIGLAGGFVEPMEANSLDLVCAGIWHLEYAIKDNNNWEQYNTSLNSCLDDTADFVSVHYTLSPKRTNKFWEDMYQYGLKHNHLQLCLDRYNNEYNTMYWTTKMRNLFPDYMWAELAIAWKQDITSWSKNTEKQTQDDLLDYFTCRQLNNINEAKVSLPYYEYLKTRIHNVS